jgi:drug/metabolite transporter (DMT)-like permease
VISVEEQQKYAANSTLFLAFPACMQSIETVCKCIATILIPASTVEMLGGTGIIYAALLTKFLIGKRLSSHQKSGIFFIIVGVILVAISCISNHSELSKRKGLISYSLRETIFGIFLLQLGIFMGAVGFVFEEKLMRHSQKLDPIYVVGCEGAYGCIIWLILLPILYVIPCSNTTFCSNGRLEDFVGAWADY